jgi:adenosylmethionine-8-amino-7-oxononanoate aminotransferase
LILRIAGNRIAFSPPLIITKDEMVELAARLRRTLDATYSDIHAR